MLKHVEYDPTNKILRADFWVSWLLKIYPKILDACSDKVICWFINQSWAVRRQKQHWLYRMQWWPLFLTKYINRTQKKKKWSKCFKNLTTSKAGLGKMNEVILTFSDPEFKSVVRIFLFLRYSFRRVWLSATVLVGYASHSVFQRWSVYASYRSGNRGLSSISPLVVVKSKSQRSLARY